MFCCGGAEEETAGPPANQYATLRKGTIQLVSDQIKKHNVQSDHIASRLHGGDRGEPKSGNAGRSGAPAKALPIELPALSLDELNKYTNNFSQKTLVGEVHMVAFFMPS
ncbi:hypothetical protein RDABS01_006624 [Bienertia sinuspersici]